MNASTTPCAYQHTFVLYDLTDKHRYGCRIEFHGTDSRLFMPDDMPRNRPLLAIRFASGTVGDDVPLFWKHIRSAAASMGYNNLEYALYGCDESDKHQYPISAPSNDTFTPDYHEKQYGWHHEVMQIW